MSRPPSNSPLPAAPPPSTFRLPPSKKVAIVCDWLVGIGGAERVIVELHKMFPEAPIYTSQYDPQKIDWLKDADVRTTWLQRVPAGLKKFLPVFRAIAFSRLNLSDYDLVISAGGAEAKAVKTGPNTLHVNYCYAPTHYYWSRYDEYMEHPGFGAFDWLAKIGLKLLVGPLRRWDYNAAQRPDHMIGISSHIKSEIKKYYGRDVSVIHPPVNTERFHKSAKERSGFVVTGRQTPYKRIDLPVAACTQLNLPLTVIGNGPVHNKLVSIAGPSVTFKTDASDAEVSDALVSAKAFIFPSLEDFGIAPVEAMAAGTPVIAYKDGGALDYVIDGKSGTFFNEQTVESLVEALTKFQPNDYSVDVIQKQAENFSETVFANNFRAAIQNLKVNS